MEQRIWYFKHGTVKQPYDIIYDDGTHICVRSVNSGKYSYGMTHDFGTLYGFPVNQSCLTLSEIIERLQAQIDNSKRLWANFEQTEHEPIPDCAKQEWAIKSEMIKRLTTPSA